MQLTRIMAIGAVALTTATVSSCGNKSADNEDNIPEINVNVCSVDSVVANAAAMAGDTVTVEGVCSHVCARSGKKAFLYGADTTTTIMCMAGPGIPDGVFDPEIPGKTVTVMGVVTPITMSGIQLERIAAHEAEAAEQGHCDAEAKANGTASAWLDSLNRQIEAGGDTVIVTGYYINASSYGVTE